MRPGAGRGRIWKTGRGAQTASPVRGSAVIEMSRHVEGIVIRDDESVDGLLRNKIRVIQAAKGYRVSEDALFLTAFARPRPNKLILDIGSGCGVIAFGLIRREPSAKVVGLEIQRTLADRARRAARLNRMEHRVLMVQGDLRDADDFLRPETFDMAVSNPPYYAAGSGRVSAQTEKAVARHQIMMPPEDLLRVAGRTLKPNGRLCLIYPSNRFGQLSRTMKDSGFSPARVLWIHPREGANSSLVCVEARQEEGSLPRSDETFILYDASGARTHEAEAILSGERDFIQGTNR